MKQEIYEFEVEGARDPRVKGTDRILVVTFNDASEGYAATVRLEVRGHAIDTSSDGLFTLSDVTIPRAVFDANVDVLVTGLRPRLASTSERVR